MKDTPRSLQKRFWASVGDAILPMVAVNGFLWFGDTQGSRVMAWFALVMFSINVLLAIASTVLYCLTPSTMKDRAFEDA